MENSDVYRSIEFIVSTTPLIVSQLALPPISFLQGIERPPEIIERILYILYDITSQLNPGFMNINYVYSLLFDENSYGVKGHEYKNLSYMFIHSDYNHLFSNIIGILSVGYPLYNELGSGGVYSTFIFGGVLAIVPSYIYELQKKAHERDVKLALPLPNFDPNSLPGKFKSKTADVLSSLLFSKRLCCGSSGGVFALMGGSIFILSRQLYYNITEWRKKEDQGKSTKSVYKKATDIIFYDKLKTTLNKTVPLVLYLIKEINILYNPPTNPMTLTQVLDVHSTHHAAHIQGGLFGILWAAFIINTRHS